MRKVLTINYESSLGGLIRKCGNMFVKINALDPLTVICLATCWTYMFIFTGLGGSPFAVFNLQEP